MALANCRRCGGLFNQITRNICDACYKQEEEDLVKVQHYIRDSGAPGMTIQSVAEENEVDEEMIRKWIREKRLVLKTPLPDANGDLLECESCGAPITTGRLCLGCSQKLTDTKAFEQAPQDDTDALNKLRSSRRDQEGGGSMIIKHRR